MYNILSSNSIISFSLTTCLNRSERGEPRKTGDSCVSDAAPSPTPLPATQTTFAVYSGPPLDSIKTMVALEFQVKDAFLDPYGIPTVQVAREPAKENPYLKAGLFAGGLLSIIGLHEFGHKAAARHHKMDATLPYFVPGPPPIGTFGALISLKSPPANRDQLFDLGLSGPVIGFVVTIAVAVLSVLIGFLPNASQPTDLTQSGP